MPKRIEKMGTWKATIAGVQVTELVPMRSVAGREVFDGPALIVAGQRAALRLASEGRVSGDVFAALRRSIAMSARELGHLLGVNEFTISRWENERSPVDRAAWATLCALVEDEIEGRTTTADRLRAAAARAAE